MALPPLEPPGWHHQHAVRHVGAMLRVPPIDNRAKSGIESAPEAQRLIEQERRPNAHAGR
jgi:hypothetical protein